MVTYWQCLEIAELVIELSTPHGGKATDYQATLAFHMATFTEIILIQIAHDIQL
jgi:hypothetical protein